MIIKIQNENGYVYQRVNKILQEMQFNEVFKFRYKTFAEFEKEGEILLSSASKL